MDVSVRGASDIARVAAEVRRLGNGREIPNKMAKRIRRAVPPIRKGVKASALSSLPSTGGLNAWVAKAGVRASIRRGPRNAGVSLVSSKSGKGKRHDVRSINAGSTRHPTGWGAPKTGPWVAQALTPGYFDRGVQPGVEVFGQEVLASIDDAVREVFGG